MDIYILHKGQESGPYSEKAVAQLLDQGSIAPSDFAWRDGWPDWRPLSEFLTVEAPPATDLPKPAGVEEMPPRGKERSLRGEERPPREEETPAPAKEKVAKGVKDSKEPRKEDERTPLAEPMKSSDPAEPASAKQKALLTFLRMPIAAELTKDQAARIINDVMEDPQHARRLSQWSEERFRLHPELFAAEIQAKKENRANHFFELCETVGAEYFNGISKAHCQVLVSFLDVKFPQWDAGSEAAEHYFFPAVAEKFPQLVHKQWKERLKYNEGGRVASEIVQKSGTSKIRQTRTSPAAAVVKGTVIGLVILGALYLGHRALRQEAIAASAGKHPASEGQNSEPGASITPASPAPVPTIQPAPETADVSSTPPPNSAAPVVPPVSTTVATAPASVGEAASSPGPAVASAIPPAPSIPSPMGDATGMAPMTSPPSGEPPVPVAPPAPTFPVAGGLPTAPPAPAGSPEMAPPVLGPDPNAGSGAAAASGAAGAAAGPMVPNAPSLPVVGQAPASATAAAKINLLLTKPVEIQLAYGKIMLPPGTPVKLMSRQGFLLKVAYQSSVITVPVGSTDLE